MCVTLLSSCVCMRYLTKTSAWKNIARARTPRLDIAEDPVIEKLKIVVEVGATQQLKSRS